jgi:hypothetical protein
MNAVAFIDIRKEPGTYYNKEIKKDVFGKFASNTHKVCIGIKNRSELDKWYYDNHGWYQGSFFIKNPMYLTITLDNFKKLLKELAFELGFDKEGKKYFKAHHYSELTVKITDFMDKLMTALKQKTNNTWNYKDGGGWKPGYGDIKKRFQIIDNEMKGKK